VPAPSDASAKFGLNLQPNKTKLVEFGRFAQRHAGKRGRKRPGQYSVRPRKYADPMIIAGQKAFAISFILVSSQSPTNVDFLFPLALGIDSDDVGQCRR
jgi:hypothetical protein